MLGLDRAPEGHCLGFFVKVIHSDVTLRGGHCVCSLDKTQARAAWLGCAVFVQQGATSGDRCGVAACVANSCGGANAGPVMLGVTRQQFQNTAVNKVKVSCFAGRRACFYELDGTRVKSLFKTSIKFVSLELLCLTFPEEEEGKTNWRRLT